MGKKAKGIFVTSAKTMPVSVVIQKYLQIDFTSEEKIPMSKIKDNNLLRTKYLW